MESLHIVRLPEEQLISSGRDEPKKELEDLVAEAEHSHSLMAYSSNGNSLATPSSDTANDDDPDVYAQLAQKEKDLVLAAELGKALLEKNEDLSRQNEKIAEEFSQRLEVGNFGFFCLT